MDRLTARNEAGFAYLVNVKPNEQEVDSPHKNTLKCILDCFERLAQYEDTGLTPEEILKMHEAYEYLGTQWQLNGFRDENLQAHIDNLEADLSRYKQADQEGRLVVLPCKVGDTVWAYDDVFNQIAPHQVDMVELYGHKGMSFCSNWRKGGELMADLDFDAEDFGKTVFLTRAEAEAALKGAEHE